MNVSILKDFIFKNGRGKWTYLSLLFCFFLQTSLSHLSAQDGYYHLITASFKTFDAASNLVKGLQSDKDYDPVILFPTVKSSFYRVSIYHSFDRKEVIAYNRLLKNRGKKTGWVFAQVDESASYTTARSGQSPQNFLNTYKGNGTIYHLIVGSFNTLNQAFNEKQVREDKGFEPYILDPDATNAHYRVAVYFSDNRKEVERYSNLLKRRGENGGWIYEDTGGAKTSVKTDAARLFTVANNASTDQTKTYHLIGGSFKRFDQASNMADALKKKGIDPLIMWPEKDGGYFKVSVYRSRNRQDVEAFGEAAKKNGIVNGWIFTQ